MFTADQIASLLTRLRITHVVTVPDSTIGQWDQAITASGVRLIRVCREGEAWAVAAGLYLGGSRPLVMIQCTGLFESGDSLRNALHDWKLPIPSLSELSLHRDNPARSIGRELTPLSSFATSSARVEGECGWAMGRCPQPEMLQAALACPDEHFLTQGLSDPALAP
jgi:hypothetical protein